MYQKHTIELNNSILYLNMQSVYIYAVAIDAVMQV